MSDLRNKRPRLGARIAGLALSPEERLVLARIDGELSVEGLAEVTGMNAAQLDAVVTKLADAGAIELDDGKTSLAEFAAVLGMDPSSFGAVPVAAPVEPDEPAALEEVVEDVPLVDEPHPAVDAYPTEEHPADGAAEEPTHERDYVRLYHERWKTCDVVVRARAARIVHGADLSALCFDPDPVVIDGILENPRTGFDQIRLIATHHRTATGLEMITRRQDFLRDAAVMRRLLKNPAIGEIVLGRVVNPLRVFATYRIAIDRDVPEITRVKCRGMMRKKWQSAPPEERADFLLRTEARCLALMTGCTFDAKTTAILCGRPINSVMFVQSVVKFAASPPALLAHLYKQAFVRKSPPLKKLLLAHPNLPGDIKRQA